MKKYEDDCFLVRRSSSEIISQLFELQSTSNIEFPTPCISCTSQSNNEGNANALQIRCYSPRLISKEAIPQTKTPVPSLGLYQMKLTGETIFCNSPEGKLSRTKVSNKIVICNLGYLYEFLPRPLNLEIDQDTTHHTCNSNQDNDTAKSYDLFQTNTMVSLNDVGPFLEKFQAILNLSPILSHLKQIIIKSLTFQTIPGLPTPTLSSTFPLHTQQNNSTTHSPSHLGTKEHRNANLQFSGAFDVFRLEKNNSANNPGQKPTVFSRHLQLANILPNIIEYYQSFEQRQLDVDLEGFDLQIQLGVQDLEPYRVVDVIIPSMPLLSMPHEFEQSIFPIERKQSITPPKYDLAQIPLQLMVNASHFDQALRIFITMDQFWFGGRFLTCFFQQ